MARGAWKLTHFFWAVAILPTSGCAARAEDGVKYESVDVVVPSAEGADPNPRMGRLGPLRDQLEENARIDAENMGIEAESYSTQIGRRGKYLLSAAMGPEGGVFFIAPFLGPYSGPDGHDPWASVATRGREDIVAVCRIVVIRNPDTPLRAAKFEDFLVNWPDHECNKQKIDMEQRGLFDQRLAKSGYSIFRKTAIPDGGRAWLVELPNGRDLEFDVEEALELVASERRIVSSMALFPFDEKMGVADLDDGTRHFFYDKPFESSNDPRVCVVEGIAWKEFATWRKLGGKGPLKQWCDEALRAQAEVASDRFRKKWEGEPGPGPSIGD